tara:strand:- start:356 stop:1189 length:834 start_codon:yes stop_codon:yes gene_type:complete
MLQFKNYNFNDSLLNLKRLNRVFPDFYNFDLNTWDTTILEDTQGLTAQLLSRYSPLTVLKTLEFIIVFLEVNEMPEDIIEEYNEIISDLIDMKNNPNTYLKIASFRPLHDVIDECYDDYMKANVSFTNFRNFMFLAFLIYEIPIKLHHLIFVEYVKNKTPADCLSKDIYLLHDSNNNTFTLIFNKRNNKKLEKQICYKIRSSIVERILLKYISHYKKPNLNTFFTSASGRVLKKSNISNGIMNFTKKIIDLPVTIHDLRQAYIKLPDYEHYKDIFTF